MLNPIGGAVIARAMTEGAALALADNSARPSVACVRTRHLPLAGEDGLRLSLSLGLLRGHLAGAGA